MQINFNKITPAFRSTGRFYDSPEGDSFGCNSWLFRDDLNWKSTAKYEAELFKDRDKVNIEMYACSDGSEGYTKIISLYEHFGDKKKEAEKFFPIKAYDIDEEILKAARSGYINTCLADRMNIQMACENCEDYFESTDKSLEISDDVRLQAVKTLRAKEKLTDNINFMNGDMFKKITELNDDSNTILMCRNILGYFLNNKIEEFVKLVSQALKSKSLFEIGDHDTRFFDIKSCIERYGFREVMKNVYKKL